MKKVLIKSLKIGVPIAIGIYLSWYFFSGLTDKQLDQTKNAFYNANYFWVFLSLFVSLLSHVSRSYRWLFLLETMGYKPKFSNAYHAVMSGYIINFTVPRSGEIARAGLLATYEKVPFEKGFATIVVERVVDVIMLGIVVLISGYLQSDSEAFNKITQSENGGSSNLLWYILIGMLVVGAIGLFFYLKSNKFKSFVNEKLLGFYDGLKSIWTMKKKWAYIFHTVFIWVCYISSIWIAAFAFEETKEITVGCVFGMFVVGAAAISLLPGGIGAYPAWLTSALLIYGIDFAGFGVFTWVGQTLMLVVLGLISLFLIQRQPKFEK